jgi:HK97 family phage prohead protease
MKEFVPCNYVIKDLTEKGVVQFYANTFNSVDTDYDISLPGSFKKTLKDNGKRLRHFKYHDPRLMPGVIVEAKEDEIGLLVTSQLILETQLGRETYEEYKALADAGTQMEHSIGVQAIKYEMDEKKGIRTVSEWKLWEVSTLTAWGANDGSLTREIKSEKEMVEQIAFLKALLNIKSYDDVKLEEIDKQINYLLSLKAVPGAAAQHSRGNTLEEWKRLLNLNY